MKSQTHYFEFIQNVRVAYTNVNNKSSEIINEM